MSTWDAIGHREGTDKARYHPHGADGHGYLDTYQRYWGDLAVGAVFELGVDKGASLRTWCDIWPDATVVGADIVAEQPDRDPGRAIVRNGNATDRRFLDINARMYGPFDVVVDDASHAADDIVTSFGVLFGWVRPGGWYAIEDLYHYDFGLVLPRLSDQAIARVILEPDAMSAERNIDGQWLILVEHR